MRYYLGLDGGGTKTAAAILDEDRREVGRGCGGACNIATGADETLRRSVREAVESALKAAGLPEDTQFAGACAGVAGYTAKKRRADFAQILADSVPAESHRVEPDFVIAYWGATEGTPGIIVIAGTGAAVYGRNAAGDTARADGRGYLLGDFGSGFWMARYALEQLTRYLDRDRPIPPLHQRLLSTMSATDADDIVEWVYRDFSPGRLAGLAAEIVKAAESGDADGEHIVRSASRHLANESVLPVADRLAMWESGLRVYKSGGIWDASPYFSRTFEEAVCGSSLEGTPRTNSAEFPPPRHDAAYGAALLAISLPA